MSFAALLAQRALRGQIALGSIGNEIPKPAPSLTKDSSGNNILLTSKNTVNQAAPPASSLPVTRTNGGRTRRRFKKKRLMSRAYCKKTPCRHMGFTQKASCRPYKNCYTRRR
jgi:hypothetical protein